MLMTQIPILLPTRLPTMPGKSIEWGMSQADCLAALGNPNPVDQDEYYAVLALQLNGSGSQPLNVVFMFDDDEANITPKGRPGLWRIEATLYETQNFLDEPNAEAIDALTDKFQEQYDNLVDLFIEILGEPDFDGESSDEDYPDDQAAWQIASWNRPNDGNSRLQLEFDHPDRESPLTIKVVCYKLLV